MLLTISDIGRNDLGIDLVLTVRLMLPANVQGERWRLLLGASHSNYLEIVRNY